MKICFIGDIVGNSGRRALKLLLPDFIASNSIDATIINAENSAHGLGVSTKIIQELNSLGCDCVTLGNHTFSNHEFINSIKSVPNCVRPANIEPEWPGNDYYIFEKKGQKIGVINLLGQVTMECGAGNPFAKADQLVETLRTKEGCKIIIIDFHAEATSEKQAMGYYLDGKVTFVGGTHTHVQTADERILQYGTGYITDLGMTGSVDSVLGMDIDVSLSRLAKKIPQRYEPANGPAMISGVVFETDDNGRCLSVRRFCEYE